VASALFVFLRGTFEFVQMRGWGVAVALLLGAVAVVAGLRSRPALALTAGAGFLLAAVAQVVLWTGGNRLLGGDGSTVSLWLGLGIGLVTVALAAKLWPVPKTPDQRGN
jgi:hypothetical protein